MQSIKPVILSVKCCENSIVHIYKNNGVKILSFNSAAKGHIRPFIFSTQKKENKRYQLSNQVKLPPNDLNKELQGTNTNPEVGSSKTKTRDSRRGGQRDAVTWNLKRTQLLRCSG